MIDDINVLARLLIVDPLKAADVMDALANKLHDQAEAIRSTYNNQFRSTGAMGDSVRMQVVDPSGTVKHEVQS